MTKYWKYISLLTPLLLVLALLFDFLIVQKDSMSYYANKIEFSFQEQEKEAINQIKDKFFFQRIYSNYNAATNEQLEIDSRKLSQLAKAPYTLFLYENDSLLFWTNNKASIGPSILEKAKRVAEPHLVTLANGSFELIQTDLTAIDSSLTLYAAIPIKRIPILIDEEFLVDNPFLEFDQIQGKISISEKESPYPIRNDQGQTICYLESNGPIPVFERLIFSLILYSIAFLFLLLLVNKLGIYLSNKYSPWLGAFFLFAVIFGTRWLGLNYNFIGQFEELKLFSKSFDSPFSPSIGDLLINSFLSLWLMIFIHREFKFSPNKTLHFVVRFGLCTLYFLLIIGGLLGITKLFQTIVIHSEITFDFDNVFSLSSFSFLAILGIILLLLTYFLYSHRLMKAASNLQLPMQTRLLALFLTLFIIAPLIPIVNAQLPFIQTLLISFIFILLFDLFVERQRPNVTWLVVWLFVFSAYASALLYKFNLDKDRNSRLTLAKKLADPRDIPAERELIELTDFILKDDSLQQYFTTPLPFKVDPLSIRKRIDKYFGSNHYLFFSYDYKVFALNEKFQESVIEGQSFEEAIPLLVQLDETKPTDIENLYFSNDHANGYTYFIRKEIPVPGSPEEKHLVLVGFLQKERQASKLYTELLLDTEFKRLKKLGQYDYSIYRNNILRDYQGNIFDFRSYSGTIPAPGQWVENFSGDRSDIIFNGQDDALVVIGKPLGGYYKPFSLFSYLFVLMILTIFLVYFLNYIVKIFPDSLQFANRQNPSLRNRIQLSIISLTIGSFIIIGLVTVAFFRTSSIEYHENRLKRKVSAVHEDIKHEFEILNLNKPDDHFDFHTMATSISEIHRMDVNIYNLKGQLLTSSDPYVFNNEIIPSRMEATAFFALNQNKNQEIIQEEEIGGLTYKAAYITLASNLEGRPIAYLGLPYYSKARNLRSDVSDFMGTLLNVYVFLLLVAGAIAIAVANSITHPIAKIGEKLKRLQLGRNEPLDWSSQDEIGKLIAEYNQMIKKLEESTERLKLSEREGAWREMAKQVAHEIKNPLTPMKLSIQYLMHAYKSNAQDIEPLLNRVSKTLIEQIDGLSRIASEFSNFAKMPSAENQTFILNDIVSSVHHLFSEHNSENVEIKLQLPKDQQYVIFADRSHLIRVLNNLIKNAVQAIPEDRAGKIDIQLYRKDQFAIILVRDNGTGISDELKEKVFYPNFTTKNSGMGLGLAISKNIIDALEGNIYFNTIIGEGTDFYIELPIKEIIEIEQPSNEELEKA